MMYAGNWGNIGENFKKSMNRLMLFSTLPLSSDGHLEVVSKSKTANAHQKEKGKQKTSPVHDKKEISLKTTCK